MARAIPLRLITSQSIVASGQSTGKYVGKIDRIASVLVVGGTVTGTTPTLDVLVEHSLDGANWFTLMTHTQATAASTNFQDYSKVDASTAQVIGPYLRAQWTIGGTGTPTFPGTFLDVVVHQD